MCVASLRYRIDLPHVNLLLLLTAMMASLTGMVTGNRAAAAPVAVTRAGPVAAVADAVVALSPGAHRPQPDAFRVLRSIATPPSQALAAGVRPTPERRRE